MKAVRNVSQSLKNDDSNTSVYQKDSSQPEIVIYPANIARSNLSSSLKASFKDDTDTLPDNVFFDGRTHRPIVCQHPHLPGNFIAGYIDVDRDTMYLCEYPITDVSQAARCAHKIISSSYSDEFDLATDCQKAAA